MLEKPIPRIFGGLKIGGSIKGFQLNFIKSLKSVCFIHAMSGVDHSKQKSTKSHMYNY